MDFPARFGTFPASMNTPAPLAVAFREVRHFQPDDALHCEPLSVRGALHAWTIPPHRHEGLHQFLWLERGGLRLSLDDAEQRLQAPALLMLAPGCVHGLHFDPGSDGWQVSVPSAMLQQALQGAPLLAARLAQPVVLAAEALLPAGDVPRQLFEPLAAEFAQAAPGRAQVLQAQALLLATWVLRQVAETTPQDRRHALRDTLVARFRALLELHLRRQPPLEFYAGELGVSVDHLSRICRAITGQPALALMHERVLLEARRLLAYTPASVAEVAQQLGFDDPAYFSRFFARRAGWPPQAWRAALQRGEVAGP